VNQPPVANAGPDQFTQTLTAITFTGSGSYDPDGTIAAYGWAFGDGTTGSGMTVTHSYATAGSYTATLTVTDNRGLTARDTAAVSITNRAPVANAGADQTAAPGAVVSFSGAGSADPDGTIASYTWSFGDGATGSGVTTNHAYATAGTYTARLTVTDNLGATGTDTATITVAATSAGGTYVWAKTFGSAGDDRGQGVAADRNGNVFMTGAFTGTVDFGTGPLTSTHFSYLNATDYKDIVIAKYAPSGAAVWVRQIGAESNDGGNAIAVDGNGDVVVTGYCSNAVDFGNGVLTTSGGDYDIFVAKYSGVDGRYLWAKRFATAASEYGYGIAVDANGNVFATGVFYGTLDFGTGALTSSGGSADVWLAKYSPTGTPLWAKQIGGTGTDFGYGVAVDPSGNPVLVGRMSGTVSLGGGALTSAGGYDVFLAKYAAADGHYLWGKVFGGTGDDYGDAVAVDGSGDVYVTGNFPGTINFGDGGVTSAGSTDGYVAKYAGTDGHYLWAKPLGGTGGDAGSGVAVDGQQNVIVTGYFSGVVNFGTGSLASAGATDGFAVKYTSAGTPLWSKRFGGTATDFATRAATDAGGDVNVIGSYSGTSDFGGGPIPSAGGFDLFLLRLAP
jgi:PKD repeat protein